MPQIQRAESKEDIRRCHAVMAQLRPHVDAGDFLPRVERQQRQGYQLAFLAEGGDVRSVAGFRILESLAWGKFLYVDDLITSEAERSKGFGEQLFAWLLGEARAAGCDQVHLDSSVQRFGAHRFYLAQGMDITSHHFAIKVS